ncbi:MAG: CHAT domain-containing protein, partial [Actinomycetota bacterium]|nr:CHAT domain-containing protein [Actinomycetota bacterium]
MVGVGVSHFPAGQGLSDLAGVEEEIDAIASTYRDRGFATQIVLEVTRQQWYALGDDGTLARAACLHFSTHGAHVLADAPMESAIFVADGQLDGLEIAGLHLNCEVVALGSCDSGQRAIAGRGLAELPGDELFGLPAAFLAAGARSVLAAAWPADNTTAAILMAYWHRHLAAGEPADVALRHAQCDFLAQADLKTKRAYFWAPFFLVSIGAPAPIPSPVRESSPTGGADG